MAAFEAKVDYYHKDHAYGCFTISDCNRVVNLDFDYEDADARLRRIQKIETLIKELKQFREVLFAD